MEISMGGAMVEDNSDGSVDCLFVRKVVGVGFCYKLGRRDRDASFTACLVMPSRTRGAVKAMPEITEFLQLRLTKMIR